MASLRLALRALALKETYTGFDSFGSGVDFSVGFVDNAVDDDVDADIIVDDVSLIDTCLGVNNIVDEEEEEEEEMQGVELRTPAPLDSLSLTIVGRCPGIERDYAPLEETLAFVLAGLCG